MKPKRGRPPKDPDDLHTETVRVPLTVEQKAEVEAAAESAGVKVAAWARGVLLKATQKKRVASGRRGS